MGDDPKVFMSEITVKWGTENPSPETGSLRERQRVALRNTIERTAIELVHRHGYSDVTVEMICEASLTSPRTFFNYFGSKEGVIVGNAPVMPSQEETEAFIASTNPDVLHDFLVFATNTLIADQHDREILQARQEIIQSHPDLLAKRSVLIARTEEQFVRIVEARLKRQGAAGSDEQIADQAHMLVALQSGVVKFMRRKWTTPDFPRDLTALLDLSASLIRQVAASRVEAS